jgi:acyl-CoA thioesterase-1
LVVEFGTNDVGRGSIEEFTTTYPEYLDALRSESPDAKLACVGTWAPTPKSDLFDAVIQSACAERSGTYVDITDIYMDRATTRAIEGTPWYGGTVKDDAHPNDAGHRAIADAVLAVVG